MVCPPCAALANPNNYEEGREECLIIVSGSLGVEEGSTASYTVCIVTVKTKDLHHVGIQLLLKRNLLHYDLFLEEVHVHMKGDMKAKCPCNTVEPLITDHPNSGPPPNNRPPWMYQLLFP